MTAVDTKVLGAIVDAGLAKKAALIHKNALRSLEFAYAHDLADDPGDFADELVERTLARGALSVFYGDSNSGKTFLAIDVAAAVALGGEWMGRRIEAGAVVYLAAESPASVRTRLRAYMQHYGVTVPSFAIVQSPVSLFDVGADTAAMIDLVRQVERELGRKVELIVGDTLARMSAGANENSGEDMGVVVRHIDRIRDETGAHFLLIHHSGKDAAKGMRGWSGLRAAVDTEIEVTADEATGLRSAEITKQRDLPGKGERIGFRLEIVEMGTGKWGQALTSCIVQSADAPPKVERNKRQSEVDGALIEFMAGRGRGVKSGDLVEHFKDRYSKATLFRRLGQMVDDGRLIKVAGIYGLAGKDGGLA